MECNSVGSPNNHSLLIVGYSKNEEGKEYWVVRNNWGRGWGDNGYAKIAIGGPNENSNVCGILNYLHYPSIRRMTDPRYEEL